MDGRITMESTKESCQRTHCVRGLPGWLRDNAITRYHAPVCTWAYRLVPLPRLVYLSLCRRTRHAPPRVLPFIPNKYANYQHPSSYLHNNITVTIIFIVYAYTYDNNCTCLFMRTFNKTY